MTNKTLSYSLEKTRMHLSGCLVFETVEREAAKLNTLVSTFVKDNAGACLELYFSDVLQVDSAGLALVVSLRRSLQEKGCTLLVVGAPKQLSSMMSFYGVSEFIKNEEKDVIE